MKASVHWCIDCSQAVISWNSEGGKMMQGIRPDHDREISLGATCMTKYQIARRNWKRRNPDQDIERFRIELFNRLMREHSFDTHIFDWAITPIEAVVKAISSDFERFFDRADLKLTGDYNYVKNTWT